MVAGRLEVACSPLPLSNLASCFQSGCSVMELLAPPVGVAGRWVARWWLDHGGFGLLGAVCRRPHVLASLPVRVQVAWLPLGLLLPGEGFTRSCYLGLNVVRWAIASAFAFGLLDAACSRSHVLASLPVLAQVARLPLGLLLPGEGVTRSCCLGLGLTFARRATIASAFAPVITSGFLVPPFFPSVSFVSSAVAPLLADESGFLPFSPSQRPAPSAAGVLGVGFFEKLRYSILLFAAHLLAENVCQAAPH